MFKFSAATTFFMFLLFHAWFAIAAEQKLIEDITFETPSGNEERIIFRLNGTHVPKIFTIKGEQPRVVFDFKDTTTAKIINNLINTNGKFIKRIRVGIHEGENPKTRVVLDLLPDKKIDYEQNFDEQKNALIISVHYAGTTPWETPKDDTVARETTTEKITADLKAGTATPAITPAAAKQTPAPEKAETKPAEVAALSATPESIDALKANKTEKTVEKTKTDIRNIAAAEKTLSTPEETKAVSSKPATPPMLSAITFDNNSNRGEMILFKLNNFHPPIVFGLEEGQPRVVCDFKNTDAAKEIPVSIKTDGKYVNNIRISKKNNPKKVRVVLDLAPNHSYDLQQVFFKDDNLFVIIINTITDKAAKEKKGGKDSV